MIPKNVAPAAATAAATAVVQLAGPFQPKMPATKPVMTASNAATTTVTTTREA